MHHHVAAVLIILAIKVCLLLLIMMAAIRLIRISANRAMFRSAEAGDLGIVVTMKDQTLHGRVVELKHLGFLRWSVSLRLEYAGNVIIHIPLGKIKEVNLAEE